MPKLPKDPCIDLMIEAAGGKMDRKEASELLDHFNTFLQRKKKTPNGEDLIEALRTEVARVKGTRRAVAYRAKVHEILNRAVQKNAIDRTIPYKDRPGDGIKDMNQGGTSTTEGSRDSVDYNRIQIFRSTVSFLKSEMDKIDGAFDLFVSRKFDDEIAAYMDTIGTDKKYTTAGEQAKAIKLIGDTINTVQNKLVAMANRRGAFISAMPGYIVRRSHDVVRMKKEGRAAWIEKMKQRFGNERTYKGADPDEFWNSAWEAITTGVRLDNNGSGEGAGFAKNLANRLSEERVFHANSAADEMAHIREFGVGSLSESVMGGLEQMSNAIALMEKWGPNPKNNFDAVLTALRERVRKDFAGNDKAMNKALKSLDSTELDHGFKILTGEMRPKRDTLTYAVFNKTRLFTSLAKLGFAAKYGVTVDPAMAMSQLRFEGVPLGKAIYDSFRDRLLIAAGGDKDVLRGVLAMAEGWNNEVIGRFSAGDDFNKGLGKVMKWYMKVNLTAPLDKLNRAAFEYRLQGVLGDESGTAWGKLSESRRTRLAEYKINEADWEMLRKAVYKSESGLEFMQPRMIREKIRPEDISGPMEKQWKSDKIASLKELKKNAKATAQEISEQADEAWNLAKDRIEQKRYDELEMKLGTYLTDATDMAIVRPGVAEQVFLGSGLAPKGTIWGEVLGTVMQFKSFPIAAFRKGLIRQFRGKGISGAAGFVASTTLMAYFTIALEDLVRGTDPTTRDWKKPAVHANAIAKAGGFGVYGDFVLGTGDILEGLVGPTIGPLAGTATGIRDHLWAGEPTKAADVAGRKAVGMLPFANFWATKTAMDYLIYNHIYEWMNPGYLNRKRMRQKREGLPEPFVEPKP